MTGSSAIPRSTRRSGMQIVPAAPRCLGATCWRLQCPGSGCPALCRCRQWRRFRSASETPEGRPLSGPPRFQRGHALGSQAPGCCPRHRRHGMPTPAPPPMETSPATPPWAPVCDSERAAAPPVRPVARIHPPVAHCRRPGRPAATCRPHCRHPDRDGLSQHRLRRAGRHWGTLAPITAGHRVDHPLVRPGRDGSVLPGTARYSRAADIYRGNRAVVAHHDGRKHRLPQVLGTGRSLGDGRG